MSNEPQTSIPSLMDQANLAKYYDPEHGIRYEFNVHTGNWDARRTRVRLTEYPFARGGMRYCHFVREVESDGGEIACIAKFFLPSCKAKHEDYFMEAGAQCTADSFAQEYNRRHTPQKIAFLSCCVVHLVNRRENNIFIMEPLLKGEFTKHNNNFGAVFTDQITPEAFSHFTFEISNGRMLVCDIQGVGEFFTDPQIHTPVGIDYGMGNMGTEGIDRWMRAHRCNDICRSLRLTPIRALQLNTMPPSNWGTTNNTNKMNTHREYQGVEEQKIELEKRPTLQEQIKDLKNMSLRETQTPEKPISQITDQLTENTKDRLQSEGERAPIPDRSEEASMDSIISALEVQSVAMQSYYRLRETARRQEAEAQEEAQRSGTRQVSTPASLLQPRQESHLSAVQEPSAEEQRASSADSSTQDETERETSPTVVAFEVQPLPGFPSVSSSTHFYEENAASADTSQNASPSRNTTESSVAASDSCGPTSPLNRSSKTPSRPSARPVSPNTRDLINSMSEEDRLEEAIRRSLLEM